MNITKFIGNIDFYYPSTLLSGFEFPQISEYHGLVKPASVIAIAIFGCFLIALISKGLYTKAHKGCRSCGKTKATVQANLQVENYRLRKEIAFVEMQIEEELEKQAKKRTRARRA